MSTSVLTTRRSDEFPRTFVPISANLGDWADIEPLYANLLAREIDTLESLESWLLDGSELDACIAEEHSRRYIAMTCNTEDSEIEAAYLHFIENIEPRLKTQRDRMNRKLLESPSRALLSPDRYGVLLRMVENQANLFRAENVPLQTEDDKLRQQYQKTCGAMTVQFQGEEKTLPQMRKYQEETDRALRQSAWETVANRYLADKDVIDDLFSRMVELRHQVARNAGFDNYRDYQHQNLNRFDYTPDDCFAFHTAVETSIVPIVRKLADQRRADLGLEALRPWDLEVDSQGRPPLRPFDSEEKLIAGCLGIFQGLDPELGIEFQSMQEQGLLDLSSRKGKAPGGYQSSLEEVRLPFIFMNAAGTDQDVFTLLHEGGHAFHSMASRNEPLIDYRSAPIEFCEVASMGMELLALPHLDAFYSEEEAARSSRSHLESALKVLAWIATIDAFQHWIYENPTHTVADRGSAWIRTRNRFAVDVDWSGYEEIERNLWHRQLHPFCVPFYYIEYGIAQIGALQLWAKSIKDPAEALAGYKRALALGGTRPLPELFDAAGIQFSFTAETIEPIADALRKTLKV